MSAREGRSKKSTSTVLVEIAQDLYSFGVSTLGETFAVPKNGHKVVLMLRIFQFSLRGQLARIYFRSYQKAASQQALGNQSCHHDRRRAHP